MDAKNRTWIFLSFLLALGLSACGPMNGEKRPDPSTGTAGTSFRAVNSSKNNTFLVYSTLQTTSGTGTAESPQVGDNVFLLRSVHATDLRSPTDQAVITVTYWMPDMPAMGKSEATAIRQADGTYTVTVFFSMAGRWQMIVNLQDGSSQDEYVFETKI